ncbi:MAG: hypothetical protein AABX16_03995, partial [Nanoarchaeota archaeon]
KTSNSKLSIEKDLRLFLINQRQTKKINVVGYKKDFDAISFGNVGYSKSSISNIYLRKESYKKLFLLNKE